MARGLTLLELLVALALLGTITVATTAALRTGQVGGARVDARAEALNDMRLAQTFLRRHLETARPVRWRQGRRDQVAFEGDGSAVDFVAFMPAWPAAGGLYLARLEGTAAGLVMIRRPTAGETTGFDPGAEAERIVLAPAVTAIGFSYFGHQDGDDGARWHDRWQGQTDLPQLLRMAFQGTGAVPWPDLIVAPLLGPQPR